MLTACFKKLLRKQHMLWVLKKGWKMVIKRGYINVNKIELETKVSVCS